MPWTSELSEETAAPGGRSVSTTPTPSPRASSAAAPQASARVRGRTLRTIFPVASAREASSAVAKRSSGFGATSRSRKAFIEGETESGIGSGWPGAASVSGDWRVSRWSSDAPRPNRSLRGVGLPESCSGAL